MPQEAIQPESDAPEVITKRVRSYAGQEAPQRQRERRKKLVHAAVVRIGREGFAAASIDSLCAEAGLTKRYFYESFATREELLMAAYESVTRDYLQSILLATAPHLQDARQLVRAGLVETFGFVRRHPDKARLLMIEAMTVRGQLGNVYGQRYDEFVTLLIGFTRPFLMQSAPSDTVFKVMAKSVVGGIIHLCQGWIATDFKQPEQELVDGMERIMAGLGKELGVKGWADTP